jgi:hypothetical protein
MRVGVGRHPSPVTSNTERLTDPSRTRDRRHEPAAAREPRRKTASCGPRVAYRLARVRSRGPGARRAPTGERLDTLGPAPRAKLLLVMMLPDLERAKRIGEFWSYPRAVPLPSC